MVFTRTKLKQLELPLHFLYLKATFRKGDTRTNKPDKEEVKVRNKYLQKVPNGAWCWVLDSDEIPVGNLLLLPEILEDLVRKNIHVGWIVEYMGDKMELRPRLIRKREGMRYAHKHDEVYWNGKNILDPKWMESQILNIGFFHYHNGAALNIARAKHHLTRH